MSHHLATLGRYAFQHNHKPGHQYLQLTRPYPKGNTFYCSAFPYPGNNERGEHGQCEMHKIVPSKHILMIQKLFLIVVHKLVLFINSEHDKILNRSWHMIAARESYKKRLNALICTQTICLFHWRFLNISGPKQFRPCSRV